MGRWVNEGRKEDGPLGVRGRKEGGPVGEGGGQGSGKRADHLGGEVRRV